MSSGRGVHRKAISNRPQRLPNELDFARLSDSVFARTDEEFGLSQLTAWSPFFQSKARMRGRSLQLAKKVRRLPPEDGELVRAEVDGEQTVTVSVKQEANKAVIECDSPQAAEGVFCEHIWATLLHVMHEPAGPGAGLDEIIKLKPQPPKARKRAGEARALRNGNDPKWMGRLAMLRPSAVDGQDQAQNVFPVQRQVCYAVLPRVSQRHNGLVVELRQRVATGTGWGKPKPLKVSADVVASLTDPRDREICSLLLGATWVTEHEASDTWTMTRSHAMYRVPPQAQVPLLKQMIATRRCYIDDPEAPEEKLSAIAWDDGEDSPGVGSGPWSLHLHAVYDEDQLLDLNGGQPQEEEAQAEPDEREKRLEELARSVEAAGSDFFDDEPEEQAADDAPRDLLVDLQMRRGGRRVPIEAPQLVLGGPNGMVIHDGRASAFDDREAWRWVSQFRDGRYTDDATERSVMRIEADQVEKFLDRLYLLPHLPELDLPEGLGRAEQNIQPVPHLDLFSPTSAPAVELAPSTAKNNVVARLWFAYGEQRVSPIAPGRFVPVAQGDAQEQSDTDVDPAQSEDQTSDADSAGAENPDAEASYTDRATEEVELDENGFAADAGHLIRRNRRAERQAINTCISLGLRHINTPSGDTMLLASKLMPPVVNELINRGWSVLADPQQLPLRRQIRPAGVRLNR